MGDVAPPAELSPAGRTTLAAELSTVSGMTPLIELSHVSRAIPGSGSLALRDASCVISRGEFVSVVGTSGSGKTTLLSVLGLLDRPTSGSYRFAGVDVAGLDETARNHFRGHRIGFVFQNSFLIGAESVARNVGLGLRVRGVPGVRQAGLVRAALDEVGLADAMDRSAGELSGGEKQRVAVARAIVTRPEVVLADEPTGAIDADSTVKLIALLRRINEAGTTVVVVTHDPLVAAAADRIIRIEDGATLDDGPGEAPAPDGKCDLDGDLPGTPRARAGFEVADALLTPLLRPLRSLLILLAYTLGVASMVASVGVMSGTTAQIVQRLTEAGSNLIRVVDTGQARGSWETLDGEAVTVSGLEGVRASVPVKTFTVVSNTITRLRGIGSKFTGTILITDERYMAAYGMTATSGRTDLLSNTWDGMVVVAGAAAATTLGLAAEPGVSVWVNDRPVDVAAVLAPTGDVLLDNQLYFSPPTSRALIDELDAVIEVHTLPGYGEPLAKAIPVALSPANPGQVQVSVVAQLARLQQGINSDLVSLLAVIGWVLLVLSALTAGTTMFLAVQHRSAEIALRRAMGASRGSVFRLFTLEGVAIGTAGGVLGLALGIAVTAVITRLNGWPLAIGFPVVGLAVAVGVVAGGIASIIPAVYAARRDPAQILRTV